jgi:hypothetical protein
MEAQPRATGAQLENVTVVKGHRLDRRAGQKRALPRAPIAEHDAAPFAGDLRVVVGAVPGTSTSTPGPEPMVAGRLTSVSISP